jgi:hypothetical protein
MDERISLDAIASYSETYADKLADSFFQQKQYITGPEILTLSPVQQVNYFAVAELFKAWKSEVEKLRSPYFDYSHPDVQELFNRFMNVLSRHIRVEKHHFLPLLTGAVRSALLVIFSPYDYFSAVVSGKDNVLHREVFRDELKYLKVNKAPLEHLLQKMDEMKLNQMSGNQAFALLDQILEEVNFTPADVEPFIEQFSQTVKLDPASLYHRVPSPQPQSESSPPAGENKSRPTVADNFRKIYSIRDTLTINQKFMFTKVLFNGDFELFSKIVDDLDRKDNLNGALKYLEPYLSLWDPESEEYQEFMELLSQRFS